jgi:hypothetical protein
MDVKELTCDYCNNTFNVDNGKWKRRRSDKKRLGRRIFCSASCRSNGIGYLPSVNLNCHQCEKSFVKNGKAAILSKNHFCSQSCAATYNNAHKTHGIRRSKLEVWLEDEIKKTFPNLKIIFNEKSTINSELDIYFPELKLAFELNGIFHYEPIYGQEKLSQILNNDSRKFQACLEKGIELCIINTSSQKYFKESTSRKFLNIITHLVGLKIKTSKIDYVEVV